MTQQRIPEHEEFYREEQNILERLMAGISSTDDFLRLTNILMHRQNAILRDLAVLFGRAPAQPAPGGALTFPKLGIRTVQLIKNYSARSTETTNPDRMVDCRGANRVILMVNNTLNEDVRMEVIGNSSDGFTNSFNIQKDICPSGESRAYGLKLEEWMPWIGLRVTAWTAPTTGSISASVIIQE